MVSSQEIEKIVYDLCVEANTVLPDNVVEKLFNAYEKETSEEAKQALSLILTNAQMACEKKMPLCQDTGQVMVFVKGRGKCIHDNIEEIINKSVAKAYEENYFRKSIVKNALFDRTNTKTNTPCIIYTEFSDCELEIDVLLKGGGCENVSACEMLSPTATEDEIVDYIVSVVKKAGSKGCPPYFLGIGIGGTMEYAGILSKKALLLEKNPDENHERLAKKIQGAVNELEIGAAGLGGTSTALDVKILTDFTHIACMPVAVTIDCHSMRHARYEERGKREEGSAKRGQEGKRAGRQAVFSPCENTNLSTIQTIYPFNFSTKVNTSDIQALKSLKKGQHILLSGEIYTARDMAHKKLVEMIEKGEKLPFYLKDKIIFYAGPCPSCPGCPTNSIGPTTASRMDKYAQILYDNGVLATIGKGERSKEVKGLYFKAIGGIACYLAGKVKSASLVAFGEYGTEAIYKLTIEDFPLRVWIS